MVAMAAYRAAARLKDERREAFVDYRRRQGVVHSEILAPEGSAAWLRDREALWNYVERMEGRKDAQLAREINLALPHELTDEQRLDLLRAFVRDEFVALGMVADFAIHCPAKGDDPRNFHAHILLTWRQAQADGLRRVKTREWNSEQMLLRWRAEWAARQNAALEVHGHKERVDHRSLAARKAEAAERGDQVSALLLERSAEIHVGPKARKAGLAGEPTSRDRDVGPLRMRGKRSVRYSVIDEGSRGAWNIRKLRKDAERYGKLMARTEVRLARLRTRLQGYERLLNAHSSPPPVDELWLSPQPGAFDVAGLITDHQREIEHARKRGDEVAWLIHELNLMFFALLQIRESQLTRETVWANRMKRWRLNAITPVRRSAACTSAALGGHVSYFPHQRRWRSAR